MLIILLVYPAWLIIETAVGLNSFALSQATRKACTLTLLLTLAAPISIQAQVAPLLHSKINHKVSLLLPCRLEEFHRLITFDIQQGAGQITRSCTQYHHLRQHHSQRICIHIHAAKCHLFF